MKDDDPRVAQSQKYVNSSSGRLLAAAYKLARG